MDIVGWCCSFIFYFYIRDRDEIKSENVQVFVDKGYENVYKMKNY